MDINSLAMKLKALADRGDEGERQLAQQKLDALMAKYNLTEDSILEDVVEFHEFRFYEPWEKRLLMQIGYKVLNSKSVYEQKGLNKHRLKLVIFKCTDRQALEIEYLFSFYRELFQKEFDFFFSVFIQKHRLFGELPEGEEPDELDSEEAYRMLKMASLMRDDSPLKALEVSE